ncbi:MAG: GGDEF domain-containing protein [Clostridia bacterium]
MKKLIFPLIALNAVNAIILVISQNFGWFYYIDSGNIYHRGPLFWLPVSMTVALIIMASVLIVTNRKNIKKKYYFSLVFFPVFPFICVILQIFFYGMPIMLNGVAFSLLIVFISIQNHTINTDYITGVYNRKKLETFMKDKIDMSTENKTFSVIMIDIDDFKLINDTFGHHIGDIALESSVKLLKSCLSKNDFIARFGGDEFYIVLDTSNINDLETVVSKIRSCSDDFNKHEGNLYKLSFSVGYAVYDFQSHLTVEDFQKHIDKLMYKNKRLNKKSK